MYNATQLSHPFHTPIQLSAIACSVYFSKSIVLIVWVRARVRCESSSPSLSLTLQRLLFL